MRGRVICVVRALIVMLLMSGCAGQAGVVQVQDAWARVAASGGTTGAFALIVNGGSQADRLTGAECSAARAVEIHESSMEGDIMRMRPVEAVEIPADGQVELKPGGYHIMLIDLQRDLQPGEKLPLTLVFEQAGRIEVEAQVK